MYRPHFYRRKFMSHELLNYYGEFIIYKMTRLALLSACLVLCIASPSFRLGGSEPNPPNWPDSVKICDPSDAASCQAAINEVYSENGGHDPDDHGQWSTGRYALFFKPGNHAVDINVGYYTSVHGLGTTPHNTVFRSFTCENGSYNPNNGALSNFWRSAENFSVSSSLNWNNHVTTLWAVSQAAPLRRVVVHGDLDLYQYNSGTYAGYASGGYMADVTVTGDIYNGS